jgi:hypothetical protein
MYPGFRCRVIVTARAEEAELAAMLRWLKQNRDLCLDALSAMRGRATQSSLTLYTSLTDYVLAHSGIDRVGHVRAQLPKVFGCQIPTTVAWA